MLRLLNLEFHKLKASRVFKIFTIAYFLILLGVAVVATLEFELGNGFSFKMADQHIFETPLLWHMNAYLASILKLILAFILITSIVNEYNNGTLKQNLIDGLSKREFVLSKIYSVLAFTLVSTVVLFILSSFMYFKAETSTSLFDGLEYLLAYAIKLVFFLAFSVFMAFLIKRSAFSMFAIFIWWVIEGVMHFPKFNLEKVLDYMPLKASFNLIPEPFTRLNAIKFATQNLLDKGDYPINTQSIYVLLIYTVVFFFLSYYIVKRQDL